MIVCSTVEMQVYSDGDDQTSRASSGVDSDGSVPVGVPALDESVVASRAELGDGAVIEARQAGQHRLVRASHTSTSLAWN